MRDGGIYMNKTSNVIDLKSRRRLQNKPAAGSSMLHADPETVAAVVDMTERRSQMLADERREVKRTILSEFIGAFILIPERGLQRVSLYDISENGLAFDLDLGSGALKHGEEVAMRVYLNQYTYFPFVVNVSNSRVLSEEGVVRHGCHLEKDSMNAEALHHFVKFIETVSASLKTDHGDVMVSGLGR